jgi:Pyruvate/2-oxoacid:ferredoxin oxidoreductase gamma subunit
MSITIGKYTFEGPYVNTGSLQDRSGVYVILCLRGGKYFVVDVGESAQLKSRVETHGRKDCWRRNCSGTLMVAALYTLNLQQPGRSAIEQEIRAQYKPPCGER